MLSEKRKLQLINELIFSTGKSSGPGGQHVNKVETRVEIRFNIVKSSTLSETEKKIILIKLANRLTVHFELIITSQTTRSQLKNKKDAILKFIFLIDKILTPKKRRKPTKPTRASKIRRIEHKKQMSLKKSMRKKPNING